MISDYFIFSVLLNIHIRDNNAGIIWFWQLQQPTGGNFNYNVVCGKNNKQTKNKTLSLIYWSETPFPPFLFRILWVYFSVGIWVYPLLGHFSAVGLLGFFCFNMSVVTLLYLLGDKLNSSVWKTPLHQYWQRKWSFLDLKVFLCFCFKGNKQTKKHILFYCYTLNNVQYNTSWFM